MFASVRIRRADPYDKHLNTSLVHRATTCHECNRRFSSAQALEQVIIVYTSHDDEG